MNNRKTLAIVLPRGEAIRNFIYTGIVQQLRERYRIVLFTVIPNADLAETLATSSDAVYELQPSLLTYKSRLVMEIADLSHNKYLWSEAAKVRWNMRDVEARGKFAKLTRWVKKQLAKWLATHPRLMMADNLLLKLSASERDVHTYLALLDKEKPDFVFNGSHVHSILAYPLMQAARLRKIPTASFLFSWDNLTSQGRIFPQSDYYFSWNKKIKADLLRIYPNTPEEHVFDTGTPQFVFHFQSEHVIPRDVFLGMLGLGPSDKYILYSSGMSHHMPYEPEVAEAIADLLPAMDNRLHMVVRTYAKDKAGVFDALRKKRKDIIIPDVRWEKNHQTPLKEDQVFFSNLLRHCTLGINVASTVSLELIMFDKPAINVGYNPAGRDIYPYDYTRFYSFDHYKPIVDSGAVTVAWSLSEMEKWIKVYLSNPELNAAKRTELIRTFFDLKEDNHKISSVKGVMEAIGQIMDMQSKPVN